MAPASRGVQTGVLSMLILFDVDATLITTSRSGIAAMGMAGRAMFGAAFDENVVEYAGRLDPLIIRDLLVAHGRAASSDMVEEFRGAYREHLEILLRKEGVARACPGVPDLLTALEQRDDMVIGLLTGNYPETGAIKLRACGIDPDRFPIQVWGCDSPHDPPARTHLPPVGAARYRARFGREVAMESVTIIGDTPHDIDCALAHGCRGIGVATGQYSVEDLERAGAGLALTNLTDTPRIMQWLTRQSSPASAQFRSPSP